MQDSGPPVTNPSRGSRLFSLNRPGVIQVNQRDQPDLPLIREEGPGSARCSPTDGAANKLFELFGLDKLVPPS